MPTRKSSFLPRLFGREYFVSAARRQPRSLRVESLEDRVLFSTTPFDPHTGIAQPQAPAVSALMVPPMGESAEGGNNMGQGSNGPEVNLPPVFTGMPPIIISEDANERTFNLASYFVDPEGAPGIQYRILSADSSHLFDRLQISGANLTIDPKADMFGESEITLRVTDGMGLSTDFSLPIHILPVNDRPTTYGIGNYLVDDGSTIVIDLFALFNDKETPDSQLTFSITENSNPELFRFIRMDEVRGTLTLILRPEYEGMSQLTLRATDSEGAYVEMGTRGRDFAIYDYIEGNAVNSQQLGLDAINLVTDFAMFEYGPNGYDYSDFSESRLLWYLQSEFYDPNLPTIFDIENEYYQNTSEGRERFAEVLRFFRQQQPNANRVGVYSFIPERNYWDPVHWSRVQRDLARGIQTGYTNAAATIEAEYDAWLQRNANYREARLADGSVVADWITWTTPSLYTFYGSDYHPTNTGLNFSFELDSTTNRLFVDNTILVNGQKIMFELSSVRIPLELFYYTEYYVVNSEGNSFQLSASQGGAPIDFGVSTPSVQYLRLIGQNNHIEHDPDFVDWRDYAAENIAEARKFGKPVVPWLSPSYAGLGLTFMDKNYFRMQLDSMYEMADGIALWVPIGDIADLPQNRGWIEALSEFTSYLYSPTQFKVIATNRPTNLGGLGAGFARRTDIFDGSHEHAFAAAPYRYDSTGVDAFRAGDDGSLENSGLPSANDGNGVGATSEIQSTGNRGHVSSQFRHGDLIALGQRDLNNLQRPRAMTTIHRSPLSSRVLISWPEIADEEA